MVLTEPLTTLGFRHAGSYWLFYAFVAWWLAWLGQWAVRWSRRDDPYATPWAWPRVVGVAIVLWPFVKLAYGVYTDFALVLEPNTVARTWAADSMWATVRRRAVQYVAIPLVGLWLAFGLYQKEPRLRLGERLRLLLLRTSLWPRRSLARDLANGCWLFVVLYFGYLALSILLAPLRRFDTGDESAVFAALTPSLAFALALTAGVTEELLFRGILQNRLQRFFPLWGAIALQSVFFGLIHSGYGTIGHVLFPVLFGIAMGLIVVWFGLLPAIMIHTGVNLVIFLATAAHNGHAWTLALIPWIFVGAIVFPALYFLAVLVRRQRAAGRPGPAPFDGTGREWLPTDADRTPLVIPNEGPTSLSRRNP